MFTKTKNKSFKWYLVGIFILACTISNAQKKVISGKVTSSEDSLGLPGVSVAVKGTAIGTLTDMDGAYKIEVPDNGSIVLFTYVGYKTQEKTAGNLSTIDITMNPEISSLEEVVVIGYGTVKKSDVTGSVSSVKGGELTAFPVLSAEQALQGRAAGVAIQSNNGGEPGGDVKMRIRGGTSINANSDPLIVVDGFISSVMPAPEDIASMEVLKDASSTAIYGSRGSNGVVLVTSKKGKVGKSVVEVNTSYSVQDVNNTLDMLDADQFGAYLTKINPKYVQGDYNTNWQDEIFRTGNIKTTQLSFSGGSDNVQYYVSGNYYLQDGVVLNSQVERYTILSNLEFIISPKFKAGLNTYAGKISKDGIKTQTDSGGTGNADAISGSYRFDPSLGIYKADGSFSTSSVGDDIDNPWAIATQNTNQTKSQTYRNNFYLNWEIIPDLNFRTSIGISNTITQLGTFIPNTLIAGKSVNGIATITDNAFQTVLSENYLTYRKSFGKNNLNAMMGFSYQKNVNTSNFAGSQGYITNSGSYHNLAGGATYLQPSSSLTETELNSVFGRVAYDYDNKYLITGTVRQDGSSNFSTNYKYAIFPSGAVAWNMGFEDFLKDSETISNWKWRASYGATGNPSIAPYSTLARFSTIYSVIGDQVVNAVAVTNLANDNLKWETTYQTDFGVDLGLFNNRLVLTADYYIKDTQDLLFLRPLPQYVGLENPVQMQNVGSLENRGYEIALSGTIFNTEDFVWNASVNFSVNNSKITSLPDGTDIFLNTAPGHMRITQTQVLSVGKPVGTFYGYVYEGVLQEGETPLPGGETGAGAVKYADVNGDGKFSALDKTYIGDPNADFQVGFNNDFKYKNFDMNLFFQGSSGGEILSYSLLEMATGNSNATTDALNAWTPTNTDTNVPSAKVRNYDSSSRFVYDSSYIRLKNISLGYSLSPQALRNTGISQVRLYVSAQNIWTDTKYPGSDPETNYRNNDNASSNTNLGLDYGSYPNVKNFTMGLNLKF